jgi:hypothetical protein
MEFFTIAQVGLNEQAVQEQITVESMDDFCDTIAVLEPDGEMGEIDTVWGGFPVQRQKIRGGVRFALLTCPNALAWTITSGFPPAPDDIVVHGTINRTEQSEEFATSVAEFIEAWRFGIENTMGE